MRLALKRGTAGIIARLSAMVETGLADSSLATQEAPQEMATALYHLWLGASVMVKITRTQEPFDTALRMTRRMLGIAGR
jgi:TetR/AcrR family transcriptional repressor of nem operon